MTGPREASVLQELHATSGGNAEDRAARALASIAVSLAALADLYEAELEALTKADEPDELEYDGD